MAAGASSLQTGCMVATTRYLTARDRALTTAVGCQINRQIGNARLDADVREGISVVAPVEGVLLGLLAETRLEVARDSLGPCVFAVEADRFCEAARR